MRRLLFVVVGLGVALGTASAACNTSDFTPATPKDCKKVACDCEENPSQPTCKGFSGQPEGGLEASIIDSSTLDSPVDSGEDAPSDAGGDAADADDQ